MERELRTYMKPEEEEALRMKKDRSRGGAMGGITWYVTTEDGREVLRIYNGKGEIEL
jgi:hypothetical protein